MKKISIFVPSLAGGGAEKVAVNLANHYAASGVLVDLVVFINVGPYIQDISSKVNVVDLKAKRTRDSLFRLIGYLRKTESDSILSVIRDSNVFVGLAMFLTKGFRGRVVFREANTLHGLGDLPWHKKAIFLLLMRISYLKTNIVIANSLDTKLDLIDKNIVRENKVVVIQNPVIPNNVISLAQQRVVDPWLNDDNLKVVLGVGRLHRQKNFDLLIESFADVHDAYAAARLIIVGEGEEEARLTKKIHALNLSGKAKIVGFQKNIYPYFQGCRVFVLSSRWEGFGNVIVEALSVGARIVSANCPGGPSMILDNGKYGLLLDDCSPKAFSDAILAAINEESFLHVSHQDLIERASLYSVSYVADRYLTVLKGVDEN